MISNLVKEHDDTKGPEAHRVYIFDLTMEEHDKEGVSSHFEYEGEKYRAFATHSQVAEKGKRVSRVKAVKTSDEKHWHANGRHGKIAEGVLEGYCAK